MTSSGGIVYLVGAGPGDPGLITVRGRAILRRADVVACDRLIGPELLCEILDGAEVVYVGKEPGRHTMTQEQISELIVARARAGKCVVRLKGGDPFVFGRGFEELSACRDAGVPCVVIPGVTSAVAAPAAAGISITDRRYVRAFAVVSGHAPKDCEAPPLNMGAIAGVDTVVILMGRENLREFAAGLIQAGRSSETPVACIERATTPAERVCKGTLGTIAEAVERTGLMNPMVAVVGEVARFADVSRKQKLPFSGRRIVITRPRVRRDGLRDELLAAGATIIECPLIHIAPAEDTAPLVRALRTIDEFSWLTFTSAHGVRYFWRELDWAGRDARSFAGCRVAAVGPATAAALRRRGVRADLMPEKHTADSLADEMAKATGSVRGRVLLPRSDIAPDALPRRLKELGFEVTEVVAYRTLPNSPGAGLLNSLRSGVDAVVFCSPSAVRSFAGLNLEAPAPTVACIGPSTAAAAREAGLVPTVVATEHSGTGLVAALTAYFLGRE